MRPMTVGVTLLLASIPAAAFQGNKGANTAQFLTLGAGARALGMGEAFGPVAEGADAIYWNPAGLAQVPGAELTYTRSELARYFHHDFAAYAVPIAALSGTLAASYTRLSQDSLPVVTNSNAVIGSFAPSSNAMAIAYAHSFDADQGASRLPERETLSQRWREASIYRPLGYGPGAGSGALSIGLSAKFISETIYDENASAVAFDGGMLYRPSFPEGLLLSAVFRNVGTKERFRSEAESLPAELSFGSAYDYRSDERRLLPALEVSVPYYGDPSAKVGVEYSTPKDSGMTLAARAGYKSQPASDISPLAGLTFGAGARWKHLSADLGFEPLAGLGEMYRLSVGFAW